ncbi:hypothetical protein AAVH_12115 [Aphelenchoides avenae]|nr:hypothetical protein AAVH_12115 [Aphelenchus avenae]
MSDFASLALPSAAPFKNLVCHYASYDIHDLLKEASEQKEDANSIDLVDRCGWQYHAPKHGACNTVECALQAIDRVMGPTCEETDSDTLEEFYSCYGCRKWNLTAVENRCFHKFLMRYSNYSARIYDSFVGTIGTYLLMELDAFGFCRHIAEAKTDIANFTERRQAVVNLVQGISKRLIRDKKILEEHAGSPKNWTEHARSVVHAGIDYVANGRDLPYPSPDRPLEKYQEVSEAIIKRIYANNFNKETYRYEIILYKPGSGLEEVCLINSNDGVVRDNYKNVNYLFSRVGRRLTSVLASRIQKENATIQASFGESNKKDLCERVRDVEDKLKYKFTGQGGFRTMLVTKCARKFVWYELAWQHFRAAWSTADNQIFVSSGNYDTQCVSVVLIP